VPRSGHMEFLREVFDAHGPVPPTALAAEWSGRELQLARRAVDLFVADLRRTTALAPSIEVRVLDGGVTAVTYNGNYQTPALLSIREPEAICEVADNLRDHVVDDLWAVWPRCPAHGSGLYPKAVGRRAVWYCRTEEHAISDIGELRTPG
jgi:hypothetical protein